MPPMTREAECRSVRHVRAVTLSNLMGVKSGRLTYRRSRDMRFSPECLSR
jgi:hypothetical protein